MPFYTHRYKYFNHYHDHIIPEIHDLPYSYDFRSSLYRVQETETKNVYWKSSVSCSTYLQPIYTSRGN